jgi:hypothetical protein
LQHCRQAYKNVDKISHVEIQTPNFKIHLSNSATIPPSSQLIILNFKQDVTILETDFYQCGFSMILISVLSSVFGISFPFVIKNAFMENIFFTGFGLEQFLGV